METVKYISSSEIEKCLNLDILITEHKEAECLRANYKYDELSEYEFSLILKATCPDYGISSVVPLIRSSEYVAETIRNILSARPEFKNVYRAFMDEKLVPLPLLGEIRSRFQLYVRGITDDQFKTIMVVASALKLLMSLNIYRGSATACIRTKYTPRMIKDSNGRKVKYYHTVTSDMASAAATTIANDIGFVVDALKCGKVYQNNTEVRLPAPMPNDAWIRIGYLPNNPNYKVFNIGTICIFIK